MSAEPDAKPKTTGRYRKVEVRTWGDAKFRALSPIPPCGQGLWLFLITGPHTGPIPGLFRAGRAAMAEELGWSMEAFDKAFGEAFRQGMVEADFEARVVWIPNAIKHNRPESPNVVRSWATEFDLIPECSLKYEALEAIKVSVYGLGEAFGKAFDETFGKAYGKPLPKAMPNQEQEKEQEEEQKQQQDKNKNLAAVAARDCDPCQSDSPEHHAEVIPPQPSRSANPPALFDQPERTGAKTSKTSSDADFERWWDQYPRRVAKAAARKSFDRILRERRVTLDQLMSGVLRYAAERQNQDPSFTKHPATWLNDGCWEDQPGANAAPDRSVSPAVAGILRGYSGGRL